jgi:hypothetical protein
MTHYVDNTKFFESMVERIKLVKECRDNETEPPIISNYIGSCIYEICNRLSYRPNFIGYSFRQEMVSDALENCIRVVDNFDPTKSVNPFAYFTQIAFYAFLRRIETEKKQSYIKHKLLEEIPDDELYEDDETGETYNFVEHVRSNIYFDTADYERKIEVKKQKRKTALEEAMEDESN